MAVMCHGHSGMEDDKQEKFIMVDAGDYVKNSILAGLFIVCIIYFGVHLGYNYNMSAANMETEYIDVSGIASQVNATTKSVSNYKSSFMSDNPLIVFAGLVVKSIWTVGLGFINSLFLMFDLYMNVLTNIFGVPAIVIDSIVAVATISMIILIWRLVKSGN